MKDIYVLDDHMMPTHIFDVYKSFEWSRRYNEVGNFQLYLPATKESYSLFTPERNIAVLDYQGKMNVMVVESVQIVEDLDDGSYLLINGSDLSLYLKRRVIPNITTATCSPVMMIERLLNENIINPTDVLRKINEFTFVTDIDREFEDVSYSYRGENLYDAIRDICVKEDLGFEIQWDLFGYIFVLYDGTDRTTEQTINPPVIFSPDYGNLEVSKYLRNNSQVKTGCYILGPNVNPEVTGEYVTREKHIDTFVTPLTRKEIFVDHSSISKTDEEGFDLTQSVINRQLDEKADEELEKYDLEEVFEGELVDGTEYELDNDYWIGDIVDVRNSFEIVTKARITEVVYVMDDEGEKYYPTFSIKFKEEENNGV